MQGIPEPVEFHVDINTAPQPLKPMFPAQLTFRVSDPWKDRTVNKFVIVHEKLFHLFVVSQDLEVFSHGHPTFTSDGVFKYPIKLPEAGMFRVLADYYPEGATPQLTTKTLFVLGTPPAPAKLTRDYAAKSGENLRVSLETVPAVPVATQRTQLRFSVDPAGGLEKYLGAWAHMLAASDDLIDLMHQHPFVADGGPVIDFSLVFPRARTYRVWVQFQRNGTVNTVHFDVPVKNPPNEAEKVN